MRVWIRCGRWLSFAVVVAALVVPGCGGGGGGRGPTAPPPPPPPPPPVSFTAAGSAGANSIFLAAGESASSTRLVLEVRASQVTDLYGVSLDIEFPRDILLFDLEATRKGDFLKESGVRSELLVENKPKGNLVIGLSRFGEVAGVDGSGVLLQVEFTARANGTGEFVIKENEAFDSAGEVQTDVSWISGSVEINL